MNSKIDWKIFLKEHWLFSALKEAEIDKILTSTISKEKFYEGNQTIFRMGESGDSLFLIGLGAVDVSLPEADNRAIPLTTLRKGEFFGEIAVFDHKPRSANVITHEPSLLLEIEGKELLNLIHDHPDIEVKLLMHLSTRLRDVSDQVLAVKVKEIDEKINKVYTRLDTEQKVIDASLKATQTIFDHTNKRASEVIESVDRSRSRMTMVASLIGGGLSTIVAVFGLIGFTELQDVSKLNDEIAKKHDKITKIHTELEGRLEASTAIEQKIKEITPKIESSIARLALVDSQIKDFQRDFTSKVLLPRFYDNVDDDAKALKIYQRILKIADVEDTDALFRFIQLEISEGKTLPLYGYILHEGLEKNMTSSHRQKVLSFYLLLTALALSNNIIKLEDSQNILKFSTIERQLKSYLASRPEPIKLKLEEDFGIDMLNQLITDESNEKIKEINKIWLLIP